MTIYINTAIYNFKGFNIDINESNNTSYRIFMSEDETAMFILSSNQRDIVNMIISREDGNRFDLLPDYTQNAVRYTLDNYINYSYS